MPSVLVKKHVFNEELLRKVVIVSGTMGTKDFEFTGVVRDVELDKITIDLVDGETPSNRARLNQHGYDVVLSVKDFLEFPIYIKQITKHLPVDWKVGYDGER
mgnify:CR=1 FL=1